jgi:hypothetical protein
MATPQRPPGNRLITGGAGSDLPAAPSHNVEPHPQACDESAEHQEAGQGASAAQSTVAPTMLVWATASRPRLDYAGQGEQDGRQNQAQAHGDSLGNLVRLEFRPLCRDPHVARCTPVPGSRRVLLDLGIKGCSWPTTKCLGPEGSRHLQSSSPFRCEPHRLRPPVGSMLQTQGGSRPRS